MLKSIKIKSANFNLKLGNIKANVEEIKKIIDACEKERVNILSLPELSLTGASLYDGYLEKDILKKSIEGLKDLLEFSKNKDILFSLGLPIKGQRGIINAVSLIKSGEILAVYSKENLKISEKGIFSDISEDHYYLANNYLIDSQIYPIDVSGIKIAVSIGEDEDQIIAKSLQMKAEGADIILNPSANYRNIFSKKELRKKISFLSKGIIYVHTSSGFGESSTDNVYTGLNILAKDGKIFKEDTMIFPFDIKDYEGYDFRFKNFTKEAYPVEKFPYLPKKKYDLDYINEALEIQARALIARMNAIGVDKVLLGVSGGIDSTIAILAINKAYELKGFDKKNILAYTLPAFGTSDRTKSNAYKLCEALGIELKQINISKSVLAHLSDIGHDGKNMDIAYENAQARMRTQVLFDLANMYGGIVIGTGDLSENMQGFATYNGDHMSSYALNSSLTKTELRYIIRSIAYFTNNKQLEIVLKDILDTPISPELISADGENISQKTEEIIGPYELIDFFIYQQLTYHKSAVDILAEAEIAFKGDYDRQTIKKWLKSYFKRFVKSQFKRSCSVDGVNVTGRSFSPRLGYKIPSDMVYEIYVEDIDKL